MASSTTGVKRSREDALSALPIVHNNRQLSKRKRRLCDASPTDLATILKSDCDGLAKYPSRSALLHALGLQDSVVLGLLHGLGQDPSSLLSIIDLNLFQRNVLDVVTDFAARGVSMTTLNIRAHSFCMADKPIVLANFTSFYADKRWSCDVTSYVVKHVFAADDCISISVLAGGGVRDVLIAEWCRLYNISTAMAPPQVIVVRSDSGRVFLIPCM